MTRERKLAIDMWLWIRDHHENLNPWIEDPEDALLGLKLEYFESHDIPEPNWACRCWFCEYIAKRSKIGYHKEVCRKKCPLISCSVGPYARLIHCESEDEWVDACTEILYALGYEREKSS